MSHIAIGRGDAESLACYLKLGADSEVRNFCCQTAQQMAFLGGRKDLEELCRKQGASRDQLAYLSDEDVLEERQRRSVMEYLMDKYALGGNTPCKKRDHGSTYDSTIAERVKRRRRQQPQQTPGELDSEPTTTTTATVSPLD